jgi:hypothetical protein
MKIAAKIIADLIEHLKLESLGVETRCFYCGGLHKTTSCISQERESFLNYIYETANKSYTAKKSLYSKELCPCHDDYREQRKTSLQMNTSHAEYYCANL